MQPGQRLFKSAGLGLIAAVLCCVPTPSPLALGQTDNAASIQDDQLLNKTYQTVLSQLTPAGREQLRKAERAWLTFTELDKIAMRTAAGKLSLSKSDAAEFEVGEVRARAEELDGLLSAMNDSRSPEMAEVLRRNDAQLNIVYQRCIRSLSPMEADSLRKAQRAWLAFLEASRKFGNLVCARLIAARTEHLNSFYIRTAVTQAPPQLEPVSQKKPDTTTPDPFERAR